MRRLQSDDPVRYRVRVGLNYLGLRKEPGEIVSDIPADDIPWLIEQGAIEPVEEVMQRGDD